MTRDGATTAAVVTVVVVVAALVVAAGVVVLLARRRRRARSAPEAVITDTTPRAAVVVNPTKFADVGRVHDEVVAACLAAGWAEPLWLETTADDTGHGQAKQALEAGVDVVCAMGGDGTVREVAEVLAHTGTPMALLPAGTGNLLARTIAVPLANLAEQLAVALGGRDRTIDVGRVVFTPPDSGPPSAGTPGEPDGGRIFLVMAGMGFDAAMMADAPEVLKARVGWLAYAISGLRNLRGPQMRVRLRVDDARTLGRRARLVMVGNCGTLTGGIVLLPDAAVDDGWLDAVSMAPQGVVSWATVAARVIARRGHARVEHFRCRSFDVRADKPQHAQLDGDPVGQVLGMRTRVEPSALVVRVP